MGGSERYLGGSMNKIGDELYIRDELEANIMDTFQILFLGYFVNADVIQRHTE